MLECKICHKEFKIGHRLSIHLRLSHNITTYKDKEKYYLTYVNKSETPKCPICNKVPNFISITAGYHKYCSSSCRVSGQHRDPEFAKAHLERWDKMMIKTWTPEFIQKMSKIASENMTKLNQDPKFRQKGHRGKKGWTTTTKGAEKDIFYDSSWELRFIENLEKDPSINCYWKELLAIPYLDDENKERAYYIDFFVVDNFGNFFSIEIKPFKFSNTKEMELKNRYAQAYCTIRFNCQHLIFNEDRIFI